MRETDEPDLIEMTDNRGYSVFVHPDDIEHYTQNPDALIEDAEQLMELFYNNPSTDND